MQIFKAIGKGFKQVSIGNSKIVCGVNQSGNVFSLNTVNSQWNQMGNGKVKQVSVGSDGSIWVVDIMSDLYSWQKGSWMKINIPFKALSVAVGNANCIFAISQQFDIYMWGMQGFKQIPGKAKSISVNSKGLAYAVGQFGKVYAWQNGSWVIDNAFTGAANIVDVADDNSIRVFANGLIFQKNPMNGKYDNITIHFPKSTTWFECADSHTQIAVNMMGDVFSKGVGTQIVIPNKPIILGIPQNEFSQILGTIKKATFSSKKVEIISSLKGKKLLVNQLLEMMKQLSFSSEKMKVFKLLAPGIVDPKPNYDILYAQFTFGSEKKEAQNFISKL